MSPLRISRMPSRICSAALSKKVMETEMDVHLGCSKLERSDRDDYRSDYRPKQVNSSYGSMEIKVPQDRKFRI